MILFQLVQHCVISKLLLLDKNIISQFYTNCKLTIDPSISPQGISGLLHGSLSERQIYLRGGGRLKNYSSSWPYSRPIISRGVKISGRANKFQE